MKIYKTFVYVRNYIGQEMRLMKMGDILNELSLESDMIARISKLRSNQSIVINEQEVIKRVF
jgi:hypothetical protein